MGLAELQNADSRLVSFINQEISIPQTARQSASKSQTFLRNVLRNKETTDWQFPNLLQRNDVDFIGGSFGRRTKIWPLDDIDLFIPLDGGTLNYVSDGSRLPFALTTDGISSNRLIYQRYMTGQYVDSAKVLSYINECLSATYSSSKVGVDEHCVNIQTQIEATSESDGIGFDVVPCLQLRSDFGGRAFYLVPNGAGGWIRTDPRYDNELCEELHSYNRKHFRKAVRLIKYWNKTLLDDKFRSYYIELSLMQKFLEMKSRDKQSDSLCGALMIGFNALQASCNSGALTSFTADAPPVDAPTLGYAHKSVLDMAITRATEAYIDLSQRANFQNAMEHYNMLFGTESFS